jgi:hypothetical protein
MTGSELAQIYEFSYGAIQRNLDGLSPTKTACSVPNLPVTALTGSSATWSRDADWS